MNAISWLLMAGSVWCAAHLMVGLHNCEEGDWELSHSVSRKTLKALRNMNTMKAVVFKGKDRIAFEEVPKP